MITEWDGEPPKCPICQKLLSGATVWPAQGKIYCLEGHYRGYSIPNMRRIPDYVRVSCPS